MRCPKLVDLRAKWGRAAASESLGCNDPNGPSESADNNISPSLAPTFPSLFFSSSSIKDLTDR